MIAALSNFAAETAAAIASVPAEAGADIALWIFNAGLASLALGLAGTVTAAVMKRRHPVLRSLILTIFLTAGCGMLMLTFPLAAVRDLLKPAAPPENAALAVTAETGVKIAAASAGGEIQGERGSVSLTTPDGTPAGAFQLLLLPASSRSLLASLGAVWLTGTGVALLLPLAGWRKLRRWKRGAVDGENFEGFPTLHSSSCPQPMCAGFFRPVILLPAWWSTLPVAARTAVLRHEAAHIRHGDLWILRLQWVAVSLQWWNPFVRALSRRLSAALEERADLAVLRGGIPAADYAQCLLDCAGRLIMPQRAVLASPSLAMASSVRTVRDRITALLSETRPASPGRIRRAASLLAAAMGAVCIPALMPSAGFAQESAQMAPGHPHKSGDSSNDPPATAQAQATPNSAPASSGQISSDQTGGVPARVPSESEAVSPAPSTPVEAPPSAETSGQPSSSPASASNEEILSRLQEVAERLLGEPSPKARKSGTSPAAKFMADQIIVAPDDSVTLKNNVKITFRGGHLEADCVVVHGLRKYDSGAAAKKKKPDVSILVAGKYQLTYAQRIMLGLDETSKLEVSLHGGPRITHSILKILGEPGGKSSKKR